VPTCLQQHPPIDQRPSPIPDASCLVLGGPLAGRGETSTSSGPMGWLEDHHVGGPAWAWEAAAPQPKTCGVEGSLPHLASSSELRPCTQWPREVRGIAVGSAREDIGPSDKDVGLRSISPIEAAGSSCCCSDVRIPSPRSLPPRPGSRKSSSCHRPRPRWCPAICATAPPPEDQQPLASAGWKTNCRSYRWLALLHPA